MRKIWAIVLRDAKLDLSYGFRFMMQWFAIGGAVASFYYVSHLVTPTKRLGFAGHSSNYFSYVIINIAFMVLMTNAVQAFAKTLRRDQLMSMVEPIFATPTSVGLLVFSSGLWRMFIAVLQSALYLTVAAVFCRLDLHTTNVTSLAIFALLSVSCMASIGIIGAAIVISSKQEPPSGVVVGGFASLVGGVLFPTTFLPPIVQLFAWILPITHSLRGFRAAVAGVPFAVVQGDALWLLVATAILLPASLLFFHRTIDQARQDGTLAHS